MTNLNTDQITYDDMTETAYIYFTEPNKFAYYSEILPENEQIIIDLGKEVPIVGVELAGDSATKIAKMINQQRHFVKKTNQQGYDYYSFKIGERPVKQSISYERIIDVKFLFADDECTDFLGIDVYSENPNYIFIQSSGNDHSSKGMLKKILNRFGK